MDSKKYAFTIFKNVFKTEGRVVERTFTDLYYGFKHKYKRTKEKYNEYINADKNTQLKIKDVGGFIGGITTGNKRVNGVRITRTLLTLDIDTKYPNVLEYLKRNVSFFCIVHSTHKHTQEENRFRLIAPLSREVNENEYEAIGRKLAYKIENPQNESMVGLFDETTFQAQRLMFFPSVSLDGEYICELLNYDIFDEGANIIKVEDVLEEYLDYNNTYEWFKPQKIDDEQIGKNLIQNKTPLKAKGMVGAFNRAYSVSEAIDKFLPHIYRKEKTGRYSYIDGESHGGGIVLNNDTIFYSHHGTDPANLYYRSAFDLVRIHLFGSFDNAFTPEKTIQNDIIEKTDSFNKMVEFCRGIPEVVEQSDSNIALKQRLEEQENFIEEHFNEQETQETQETQEEQKDQKAWLVKLDGLKSNFAKLDLIFSNDENIGNLFYYDTFRENICFARKPYWKKEFFDNTAIQDKDMAHIRGYLERVYGIKGEKTIDDAVIVEADKIQVNKVLDFFENLVWDGKDRLEFFFNEFFKVSLNPFTRTAFKHWLVGAVSRIYRAGAPMDLLLVIKGKQGIGKSLFFKRLATLDFSNQGEHLYSDTKIDFDKAKDSYEQLEGIWIYEWKELAGMNMSEQESIKAFVDKTEDKFRRSYGRRNVEIKRRVAFGGTTNEKTPLRDRTGNRRFLVMDSPLNQNECYIKNMDLFSQEYRDQLLAEAVHLYKSGFDIFSWTDEEERWWQTSNAEALAENDLVGNIQSYLEMLKPVNWYSMPLDEMYSFINDYDFQKNRPNNPLWKEMPHFVLDKVCIQELWKIGLKQRDITINRYHRDLIIQALELLNWKQTHKQQRFGVFGTQIAFEKEVNPDDETPF